MGSESFLGSSRSWICEVSSYRLLPKCCTSSLGASWPPAEDGVCGGNEGNGGKAFRECLRAHPASDEFDAVRPCRRHVRQDRGDDGTGHVGGRNDRPRWEGPRAARSAPAHPQYLAEGADEGARLARCTPGGAERHAAPHEEGDRCGARPGGITPARALQSSMQS